MSRLEFKMAVRSVFVEYQAAEFRPRLSPSKGLNEREREVLHRVLMPFVPVFPERLFRATWFNALWSKVHKMTALKAYGENWWLGRNLFHHPTTPAVPVITPSSHFALPANSLSLSCSPPLIFFSKTMLWRERPCFWLDEESRIALRVFLLMTSPSWFCVRAYMRRRVAVTRHMYCILLKMEEEMCRVIGVWRTLMNI